MRLYIILALTAGYAHAQVTTCFEIESILVDACGNPEGENEMILFNVGPSALNVSDLNVGWPSGNPWLGACMNTATASTVAGLNATIVTCGLILEPVNDILPAGAKVLVAGSDNFNSSYHSFANLTDTIYMIFQCGSNSTPNFKNYDNQSAGSRTLEMSFGAGCDDEVTYYPYLLITPNGQSSAADGASVQFDAQGNASYINEGCQAPLNSQFVSLHASSGVVCHGDAITLTAIAQITTASSIAWVGGNGTFTSPAALTTDYIAGSNDAGYITLYIYVTGNCGMLLTDSVVIEVPSPVNSFIELSSLPPYCTGESIALSISGAEYVNWSTGETDSSITVTTSGVYSVSAGNECYSVNDTVNIEFITLNAGFYTDVTAGNVPLTVVFNDTSNAGSALWQWDFGDGNTGSGNTIYHTFEFPGQYTVSEIVHSTQGCTDTSETLISVAGPLNAFIPAAFTPNSDTKNEVFRIEGSTVSASSAKIYNRWGNEIWSWNDSEGWPGYDHDGNKVDQGIYIYDADIVFSWGEVVRKRGWVMLIR